MFSILRQVLKTKNEWGLKPLIVGALYEIYFIVTHPRFKYFFVIEPQDLDISEEDSKLSDPYGPAPYYVLTVSLHLIKKVISNVSESIFVDVGCGTGRVLYCSSTVGFKRLIGIEQSGKLAALCTQNLRRYLPSRVQMKIINQNVRDINLHDMIAGFGEEEKIDSVVFFLYAPFNDEMLKIFVAKFDQLSAYDCFIVYFGPQNEEIIKSRNFSVLHVESINRDTPIKIYSRDRLHVE